MMDKKIFKNKLINESKMNLNKTAIDVLNARYLSKDDDLNIIEKPEELIYRVAEFIAEADYEYTTLDDEYYNTIKKFYNMMIQQKFIPNSPTLMNAGKDNPMLSACFVLPIEDSMESIFETLKHTALIHKSGGGTGFSFSNLRPKNDTVKTTSGVSSGPISFMKIYDATTEQIKQGGKRRGANLGCLRVDHPDILDFIECKSDLDQLNNFNISVSITDKFMQAVIDDTDYELINPRNNKVVKKLNARFVFDKIVHQAWKTGEPGIIFIDRMNQYNPTPHLGLYESTNPCVTGDTWILCIDDDSNIYYRQIKDIADSQENVDVICYDKNSSEIVIRNMINIHKTGNRPIVNIEINNVYNLRVSDNHKMRLSDDSYVMAKDLKIDDEISYIEIFNTGEYSTDEKVFVVTDLNDEPNEDVYNGIVDEFHNYFIGQMLNEENNGVISFGCRNCGEQILRNGDSCNLGSINISKFVKKNNGITSFDFDGLKEIVKDAVHFLDNVIEMNKFPLKMIEEETKKTRNIGLGVMGFADTLLKMEIPYNSEEARNFAKKIMRTINDTAYDASVELADVRGSYPEYNGIDRLRNATRTTIAPTGTISIIANCSSGIEPIFSLAYVRRIMDDNEFFEVNPIFENILNELNFDNETKMKIIKQVADEGTCQHCDLIPEKYKKFLVTSHDISPEDHVLMQASFQEHVNNAISKTINFSEDATEEDIRKAYLLAYENGCKGITVYRNNCRQNQVLHTKSSVSTSEENTSSNDNNRIKKERPKMLKGYTYQYSTGCGDMYITINEDENGNIFELFNTIGKAGGCSSSQCEAIGRLISLACRSGQTPNEIIKQLIGISCHRPIGFGENKILSCADAIAKCIKNHIDKTDVNDEITINENHKGGSCPDCGGIISYESGCCICHSCGYSACG